MGEASGKHQTTLRRASEKEQLSNTITHAKAKKKTQGDQSFQLKLVDSSDQAARDERDKVMMDAA